MYVEKWERLEAIALRIMSQRFKDFPPVNEGKAYFEALKQVDETLVNKVMKSLPASFVDEVILPFGLRENFKQMVRDEFIKEVKTNPPVAHKHVHHHIILRPSVS